MAGGSPTYGRVVNSVSTGVAGFAHHTEHQMTDPTGLFVNSFSAGKTYVMDLTEPAKPTIAASIAAVGDFADPHSFERLANGNVLATFQRSASRPGEPGGLVESFRSAGHPFGLSFDRDEWPHGKTGPAYRHGAVFRKMPAVGRPARPASND